MTSFEYLCCWHSIRLDLECGLQNGRGNTILMGIAITFYGHGHSIWRSVYRHVQMSEVWISDVQLYMYIFLIK